MLLQGKLIAETPIYRGNARKTLFTRDGDGTQKLISLAGEISGTAQALMDAFIGQSREGKNLGLLNRLWLRLYGRPMPEGLITRVTCQLQESAYPRERFFDLRMGLKLDEDRWASEANANYKMETLFRNAAFDFSMQVSDTVLQKGDTATRLYYLLRELQEGRFWFGAGKSKGLGRVRLDMAIPFTPDAPPAVQSGVNHLRLVLAFNAMNPVLVGWNWGKVDPEVPAFAAIEGRLLIEAMRDLPDPIRRRLAMVIGGPILSPDDWKRRLAEYLPRTLAVWLQERSAAEQDIWTLHEKDVVKLTKGKHPLSKKVVEAVQPLYENAFAGRAAAEATLVEALGDKANMANRLLEVMERRRQVVGQLNREAWQQVTGGLGLDAGVEAEAAAHIDSEVELTQILARACERVLPRLYLQVDQQIALLQSDAWVDAEIAGREQHLRIKTLLLEGRIDEAQWNDRSRPPEGVSTSAWQTFLQEHSRVRLQHMLHPTNLRKSIANDRNFIAFLQSYRDRARQELSQPHHVDFRAGGPFGREVSRKYGKPYDTVFMRLLTWAPSSQERGAWEVYIPGSTIKGAFRRRASQMLKTLWGETPRMEDLLNRLFGTQGQRGAVFFSDAYLVAPLDPARAWCSMDGVRMDPRTARPIETAKHDYLFAYGEWLAFRFQIDVQDIGQGDADGLSLLAHLLQDFQRGDIALGGEKTSGFGWVSGHVTEITWLTSGPSDLTRTLFGEREPVRDGLWYRLSLGGQDAAAGLKAINPIPARQPLGQPLKTTAGYISHRAFGGYSGRLFVEAEVLAPVHVQESGEPSFRAALNDGYVNGWDFFSMAPPEAAHRPESRVYALPSRSLKGMLRHIYAIASDSRAPSADLSRLNPVDRLFGWVGPGTNQALMGRLAFGFGLFDTPRLTWFKVPYPYTGWTYEGGQWRHLPGRAVPHVVIGDTWRLFPHTPLAPIVRQIDDFQPDTAQASYLRAILPGSQARFTLRFWNLELQELQRLIGCIVLEPTLAHKIGRQRYLGFGSLRLRLLDDSYLIDWAKRYAGRDGDRPEWRQPLRVADWIKPEVIAHYADLRKTLDAQSL
jgi:CRISPR/Cas system CSM-associated protein Csm3 (group 7 of RAMP superfamily)